MRYFLAVAELGSIRAASRTLNIATSAINRQVLMLERSLGQPLFERVGRGLVLTGGGETLMRSLRQTVRGFDDALDALDALKGLRAGIVRLATVESVSVVLLPRLLTAFQTEFPGIEVSLVVAPADTVSNLVLDREADLGFTFNPSSLDGLDVGYEKALAVGAIVAPGHPLAGEGSVSLARCFEFPVALPSRGLSIRAVLDTVMRRMETPRELRLEANSLRVMSTLAGEGKVVAFQTRVGIENDLAEGRLVLLALSDAGLPADRLMIVRQTGRTLSPAADTFFVRTVAAFGAELGYSSPD